MSKRYRSDRLALVGLAIFVGGAVLASFFGFLEQAQYSANHPPGSEAYQSKDWWKDTYAQWLMAIFGMLAIFVGIWTITLLRDTLRAARKGNRIARKSAERQLRAYIGIHKAAVEYQEEKGRFYFHLIFRNTGQTPAYNVRLKVEWYDAKHRPTDTPPADASRGTIGVGGEMHVQFTTEEADRPENVLSAEDCAAIFRTGKGLWVNARVEYLDAFKKPRYLNFRNKFYKRNDLYGLSATGEGNDSN